MAKVSISEAARLVNVSRPTLYKMLNNGTLTYTSVVKHGKQVKTIDRGSRATRAKNHVKKLTV